MAKITTVEGSLCSSSYGTIHEEKDVTVDIETHSFPIPEGMEIDCDMDYTVGVKLVDITISMELTIDDDEKNFLIEDSMDQSWLDYYASGRMISNETKGYSS